MLKSMLCLFTLPNVQVLDRQTDDLREGKERRALGLRPAASAAAFPIIYRVRVCVLSSSPLCVCDCVRVCVGVSLHWCG